MVAQPGKIARAQPSAPAPRPLKTRRPSRIEQGILPALARSVVRPTLLGRADGTPPHRQTPQTFRRPGASRALPAGIVAADSTEERSPRECETIGREDAV